MAEVLETAKARLTWGILIRVGITISILGYLGYKVHWGELAVQLMQSDPVWLGLAFVLLGIGFLLASVRWWLLLRVQEIAVPLQVVTALTFIGQFFNSFLLGTTGGDIIKVFYICRYTASKKTSAALSIIMDRVIGLFILLCVVLAILPWQIEVMRQRDEARAIAYALLILFGVILGLAIIVAVMPFRQLPMFFHELWRKIPRHDIIESLVVGFRQHGRSQRLTFAAVICSVAIWLLIFTAGHCLVQAMHLHITYVQILTILAIVTCVVSLPISIGGHGIREGMFVIMFIAFGIISIDKQTGAGQEPAILFSILFFALFTGWSLVGGLIYLTFSPFKNMSTARNIVSASGSNQPIQI